MNWSIEIAKKAITQIHPDDFFFNTQAAENFGEKCDQRNGLLTQCIANQDFDNFDFFLNHGAGHTPQTTCHIEEALKDANYDGSIPLRMKFIQKWLQMGFDLTFYQDLRYQSNLAWFQMWIVELAVPPQYLVTSNRLMSINFLDKHKIQKFAPALLELFFTYGFHQHLANFQPLYSRFEILPSTKIIEKACVTFEIRHRVIRNILIKQLLIQDLSSIVLNFISNEFYPNQQR